MGSNIETHRHMIQHKTRIVHIIFLLSDVLIASQQIQLKFQQ